LKRFVEPVSKKQCKSLSQKILNKKKSTSITKNKSLIIKFKRNMSPYELILG